MWSMRVLSAIGSIFFLYLAVIPAVLIYSLLDSACAGEGCESSVLTQVALTVAYLACVIALIGSSALFANHARLYTFRSQEQLQRWLALTGGVVGSATFLLFTIAFPVAAMVALAVASVAYLMIRRNRDRDRGLLPPDPFGHGKPEVEPNGSAGGGLH